MKKSQAKAKSKSSETKSLASKPTASKSTTAGTKARASKATATNKSTASKSTANKSTARKSAAKKSAASKSAASKSIVKIGANSSLTIATRSAITVLPKDFKLALQTISKADPTLGRVIKMVGPCGLTTDKMQNCFESLLEAIVYQQLTGKAAATILGRVKGLYRDNFPTPPQVIMTSDDDLRRAGLSRAKVLAIKDLSEKTVSGILPLIDDLDSMPDEEIVKIFSSVRGIGEWTVQMMLIFKLGRADVMPHNDYGVRKGFARAFELKNLPSPANLLLHSEKWRPFRSIASWYLWRVPHE